jgi:hypothetical protein
MIVINKFMSGLKILTPYGGPGSNPGSGTRLDSKLRFELRPGKPFLQPQSRTEPVEAKPGCFKK